MKSQIVKLGLLACVMSVTACNKEATGQVAAVVNGDEVTLREINAELGSVQVPEGADKKAVQQTMLQRVIERRLLAQAAREDGLDKDPEFLLRRRQLEEALLVQMLGRKADRTTQVPSEPAIDKFMNERPTMFSGRTIYAVDRIQFPMPADLSTLKQFEPDHTLEAVAARLDRLGIKYAHQPAQFDSASIPPQILERIRSLPAGEPFVIPEGGNVTVAVVTGSKPAPIAGREARPLAVQAMRNQAVMEAVQQRLKTEKAQAEIEYQEGFAPPKDKDSAAK